MKKTTRKSFSRKAIVVVMSVFLTVSLTAVGFASWLISNSDSKEGTGNVTASNVSDAILGVTIDQSKLGNINFGPEENDLTGNIRYNSDEATDKAALNITVAGTIDKYKTLDKMSITVKCPDSILTAAGYTWTGEDGARVYTYAKTKAYIALPACAVDKNGKSLPLPAGEGTTNALDFENGNELFKGSDENKKEFSVTISFGWGALFEGKNPGRCLDGEDGTLSEENKNALLAIINVGKDEKSEYKTLNAQGDAAAKRDILQAMKVAITGASNYDDAVTATAPQFTVVVNAQAKGNG